MHSTNSLAYFLPSRTFLKRMFGDLMDLHGLILFPRDAVYVQCFDLYSVDIHLSRLLCLKNVISNGVQNSQRSVWLTRLAAAAAAAKSTLPTVRPGPPVVMPLATLLVLTTRGRALPCAGAPFTCLFMPPSVTLFAGPPVAVECRFACPMGGYPAEAGVYLTGEEVVWLLLLEIPLRSVELALKLEVGGSGRGRALDDV